MLGFRREFEAWLDEHLPPPELMASLRRSSAHLPEWARAFHGAVRGGLPGAGWPPELGGRNATPQEQMAYFEVITERLVPRSLNPQGLSICAASIVEFGTDTEGAFEELEEIGADLNESACRQHAPDVRLRERAQRARTALAVRGSYRH